MFSHMLRRLACPVHTVEFYSCFTLAGMFGPRGKHKYHSGGIHHVKQWADIKYLSIGKICDRNTSFVQMQQVVCSLSDSTDDFREIWNFGW